ncbi:MAG TPA: hypothetical protein VNF68_08325, partial [Candidatus Baltobacteraceae bacterium]|nr:hypothetical protein [Candidatus Baltobacteraceae bacterium]
MNNSPRIGELAGVGPKSAPLFAALGIASASDLLEYLPFRYDDLRFPTKSSALGTHPGEENAVGRVTHVKERRVRGLEIVEVRLRDEAGEFVAKWIGRNRYVIGRFKEGMRLFVRGRAERTLAGPAINVTHYAQLGPDEEYRGEMVAIYRASKDLTTRKIATVVEKNLPALLELVCDDPVPPAIAKARGFAPLREAYAHVHMPRDPEQAQTARERFIFGEFLVLASAAALRRMQREGEHDANALQ